MFILFLDIMTKRCVQHRIHQEHIGYEFQVELPLTTASLDVLQQVTNMLVEHVQVTCHHTLRKTLCDEFTMFTPSGT